MNSTKELKDRKASTTSSSNSRAFDECIAVLFDEVRLSIQWHRPSILLAVHASNKGREKAKKNLQKKLAGLSMDIVQIRPNSEYSDLFQFLEQADGGDQFVYFVEGIGADHDNYRALNLYREKLVEQKLIVIFWLTEKEAMDLPRLAPDFWAFRHRVIEFAVSRGSKGNAPAGLLMWQAEIPSLMDGSIAEKISFQEEVLGQLPSTDEVLVLHAEAAYLLARYHWLTGENEKAVHLLQSELGHLKPLQVPDVVATFLNGLAIIAYDRGNYDEALGLLERAVQLHPVDQVSSANLAVVQHGMGKSGQAVQTIKKTIKAFPRSSWLWYMLGYILFSSGKLDQAVEAFQEAVDLNVDNNFARYAIAACQTRVEQSSERINTLQLLEGVTTRHDLHREICVEALSGNKAAALDKLRFALKSGRMTLVSFKRDPALAMIFDVTTMEFLL
jgi:tetratricopeptide (TPR) repeat protein